MSKHELRFLPVSMRTRRQRAALLRLWYGYTCEVYGIAMPLKQRQRRSMARELDQRLKAVSSGYIFELCCLGKTPVGFYNFALDGCHLADVVQAEGCGFGLEFYVAPAYRLQGIGRAMFEHAQETLRPGLAAPKIYGTPADTGLPFWKTLGWMKTDLADQSGLAVWSCEIK